MANQRENDDKEMSNQDAALRPWITPTFERVELKEAMSGFGFVTSDGAYTHSTTYS